MTYYVPSWDEKSLCLTELDDSSFQVTTKGSRHQHQNHHYKAPASALVLNHDVLNTLTHTSMRENEGTLPTSHRAEYSSIPALDVPVAMSYPRAHEDEMLSWLQYPLEDSFDRNYCSEMFGEFINPHVQLVRDEFLHQTLKKAQSSECNVVSEGGDLQQPTNTMSTIVPPRTMRNKSDAAMTLGTSRAGGLISQTGLEAFNGVRAHSNPVMEFARSPPYGEISSDGKKVVQSMGTATAPTASSGVNFSLFSRPVTTTLDNLRLVGAVSGPTNVERARQPVVKDLQHPCEASTGEYLNRSMVVSMPSSQGSTEFTSQDRAEKVGTVHQGWYSATSLPCQSVTCGHSEASEFDNHAAGGSVLENVLEANEGMETIVSPSYLSGGTSDKVAQEVLNPSPKKSSSSAQYSEDVEDVAVNAKKPPPGPRAAKRSRASDVHNESEKKRRDKINVRLKALQSLIPNSNKTDKASVLDEAIEYTKMLQAQVQFMSMKSGMFFPTMMPSGMQYMSIQQMPTPSHLGMGMGMGIGVGVDMGLGMHIADANAANIARAGVGTTHVVSNALSMACTSEPHNMTAQQLLQPVLMNAQMNPDMYSASQQQQPPPHAYQITNAI